MVVLTFLVAQFGAQAHAYSHLSGDQHELAGAGRSCGTCLSAAPLLAAVDGSPGIQLVHYVEIAPRADARDISIPFQRPHRAFQSRAPPRLL